MALDPITGGEELAGKIVDAISSHFSTPEQKQQATLDILKVIQASDLGQMQVNAAEAQNPHIFVAGWRPFIGWVCGFILAIAYIPKALAVLGIWVYVCIKGNQFAPPPSLDIGDVIALMGSLLGLGAMKSFDQFMGTATLGFSRNKK